MTVKELKEALNNLDDNLQVVIPSRDHSYCFIGLTMAVAEQDRYNNLFESSKNQELYDLMGKKIKVLVIF